ncbi:MAG: rhomboid family intramembrane serine protease [Armatimonadota bacterium]
MHRAGVDAGRMEGSTGGVGIRNPFATKDFPVATYFLIAINVFLFYGLNGSDWTDEILPAFAFNPYSLDLRQMFTSLFIHTSFLHLLGNMIFLWVFGRKVEMELGSIVFLFFFVASGFAASIMHLAVLIAFLPPPPASDPNQYVVGASGAIAGLLGVYSIRFYRDRITIFDTRVSASVLLLGWLVFQMVLAIISLYVPTINLGITKIHLATVGWWVHLGGFVFGMGFAQVSQLGIQARKEYLLSDAQDNYRRGTLLDVARDYDDLVHMDPEDPFAYAELGRTWALLGDVEQARPPYEIAISLYISENRTDIAVERFREMRSIFPEAMLDTNLQFRIGCKLEEMSAYEEAVDVLDQIAMAKPGTVETEMAALRVGEIYLARLSRPDLAASAFKRFIRMFPDSEWAPFAEQALSRTNDTPEHP